MKKLTILSPIRAATLLSVLCLASCGGDDSPTAPGGGRLDSRLFGTWESESMGFTYTFKDNGTIVSRRGDEVSELVWWIENGQLILAYAEVLRYSIRNGELTFTAVGEVYFTDLPHYEFRADDNPSRLTGTTWVDEDGDELIFSSDGTYSWGEDFESGSWIVDGNTIRIYDEPEAGELVAEFDYEVSGKTLTLTLDGVRIVFSKQ